MLYLFDIVIRNICMCPCSPLIYATADYKIPTRHLFSLQSVYRNDGSYDLQSYRPPYTQRHRKISKTCPVDSWMESNCVTNLDENLFTCWKVAKSILSKTCGSTYPKVMVHGISGHLQYYRAICCNLLLLRHTIFEEIRHSHSKNCIVRVKFLYCHYQLNFLIFDP